LINAWTDYFDSLPPPVLFEFMPESFLQQPGDTILFGEKQEGQGDFLMDLRTANQVTVIEQTRHAGGANYAFADGSARSLRFGQCLSPVNLWGVTPDARTNPQRSGQSALVKQSKRDRVGVFRRSTTIPMRKKLFAEFPGTFGLVFAGTGAIVINHASQGAITQAGIALTLGLVVMAMLLLCRQSTVSFQ
jgi:prepilin-type processing-associated H-X9-DG protein